MPLSTLRVMLQQIGGNAADIKRLIISGLIKSSNFAIFSSGGRLFHFKGSICVKKRARPRYFWLKVPIMDRNFRTINCPKCRILFLLSFVVFGSFIVRCAPYFINDVIVLMSRIMESR